MLQLERREGEGAGRKNAVQAEEKVETLGDTLEKVEAKILEDTHSEKLRGKVRDVGKKNGQCVRQRHKSTHWLTSLQKWMLKPL